jgi:hypothetical protein
VALHRRLFVRAAVIVAASAALSAGTPPQPPSPARTASSAAPALAGSFRTPPDDARIMMRWWWFGPTVSKAGLARELKTMKDGGIGGVEIQPVYPVTLDDAAAGLVTHTFLSDTFIDHVRFAARTARELGLRVDMTIGSGWPYGGAQVSMDDAAGKLRMERVAVPAGARLVPVPDIRVGERLLAAFLAPASAPVTAASAREVTDIRDGLLRVPDASAQPREALFFINSHSGMMVKRSAVGAEGYVLDHYDRSALDRYLGHVGNRLLSAFDGVPPTAVFCDSLEVYDSDWTDRFLESFKVRRGYDLRPHLPVLALGSGTEADALRHDWGQTLTDLLDEQFMGPMQAWATAHGTKFRLQGYGVPPATISSNAGVDLPEGEGAQWKTLRASRWAASIGHLYGRPVISSETWTWLHSPVFLASPLDVKAEADVHFLQGINQLIGHGWPYTADGVAYPGWRFYAAGVFNEKNPWWTVMPDLSRYLQRVSHLLRQGQPIADVAVYLPVADTWAHFVPGKIASMIETMSQRMGEDVVASILESGFNLDFVDDGVLATRASVKDGELVVGTNRYRAIVLPGIERIDPATLRRLETFAKAGVRVIATRRRPALAPGFTATAADHAVVTETAARLFDSKTFVARDQDLGAALAAIVPPDVAVSSGATAIGAVHRATAEADVYFIANTSNTPQSFRATFRVAATRAERWNPITGDTRGVDVAPAGAGTAIALDLSPYESTVIVFPRGAAPASRVRPARTPAAVPPLDLSRDWTVTVGAGRAAETWPALKSWTDDEATRYYSGVAVYEKTVDVPPVMLKPGLSVTLDLGAPTPLAVGGPRARFQAWLEPPVREAAVVFVNGERAGSVWCPPYAVDVTRWLKPGRNTVRIDVANLAINHMAGRALPDYKLLNLRYGTRFEPQDMDKVRPVPSGLFGPVRLVAAPAPASRQP